MACYSPLQGFRARARSKNGKRPLVFNKEDALGFSQGLPPIVVTVPCSQCVGCRLERSRQWAVRCMHESSMHTSSCFITLTYSNKHLPNPPNLVLRDFQLFMKRLRKKYGKGVRFYHCGEYGELKGRPHYHAIIFGMDFSDKYHWETRNGHKLYRSQILEELWPYGHSSIGSVTFESAAYVARYIMKKINGDAAERHYASCPITGEVFERKPEYTTMSRRPGIGSSWLKQNMADVYPQDHIVLLGKPPMQPPKFYDAQYELVNSEVFDTIKKARKKRALIKSLDKDQPSLASKLKVKLSQIINLVRNFD